MRGTVSRPLSASRAMCGAVDVASRKYVSLATNPVAAESGETLMWKLQRMINVLHDLKMP